MPPQRDYIQACVQASIVLDLLISFLTSQKYLGISLYLNQGSYVMYAPT